MTEGAKVKSAAAIASPASAVDAMGDLPGLPTKTEAKPATAKAASAYRLDNMADRDASKIGKTVLVYGESGVGKSTLIGTLPGRTLVIDVEGGLTVLRGHERIDRIGIPESLDNLKAVFDAIATSKCDYENIALDSGSELEKFMLIRLAAASKNDGMPSLHDYGVVSFKMRDYLRRLRDMRERGVNVIVTALEMPLELESDGDVIRTRLYPMLARKLAPEACGLFDVVARLEVSRKPGHEGERYLRLDGNEAVVAKNRYGSGTWAVADLGALFAAADKALGSVSDEPVAVKPPETPAKAPEAPTPPIPIGSASPTPPPASQGPSVRSRRGQATGVEKPTSKREPLPLPPGYENSKPNEGE